MNTPVREGETVEGSRTTRNRPYPVLKCSMRRPDLDVTDRRSDRQRGEAGYYCRTLHSAVGLALSQPPHVLTRSAAGRAHQNAPPLDVSAASKATDATSDMRDATVRRLDGSLRPQGQPRRPP